MRLVIISNRLPVTAEEKAGKLEFRESAGGLATAMGTYLEHLKKSQANFSSYLWIGWPGSFIEEKSRKNLRSMLQSRYNCYPVFLNELEMDKFYNGFCNDTLWPLFHYFPGYASFDEEYWNYYKRVNNIFLEAALEILKPDDLVWVHDYHLMLLPGLIRKKMTGLAMGFFLHIPFPSFEIFRLLPRAWRSEILEGLLGADLVGFHTHDYTQYFLRCTMRLLSHEYNLGRIHVDQRLIKGDTFPIGIDFKKFNLASGDPAIKETIEGYKKLFNSPKVILSMDRLDYSKGILNRLKGFEMFLERNPQWHGKVALICIVVPSRTGVELYQRMKSQIDETIGMINGKFGTISWRPITYLFKSLSFTDIAALYNICDIALVTPLRDGMNLVAKEYVASRREKTGVLILSEMTGAAGELGEAVIINPNYVEEITNALKEAVEMPKFDQINRNNAMQIRLQRYDVVHWAEDFISNLMAVKNEQRKFELKMMTPNLQKQIVKDFTKARRKILFLDYDGTLVYFKNVPEQALPDHDLIELLKRLTIISNTEIVIISGRDKETIESWLGMLDMSIVAEHGAWIKERRKEWVPSKQLSNDWKPQILPLLEMFSDRLPGSFVEHKEFSLVWHYRNADPEQSKLRVRELVDTLTDLVAHRDLQVFEGNKVVEIKDSGISKGIAGMHFLKAQDFDFILFVGDDRTDEDLFRVLPPHAYSIKVGMSESYAKYIIGEPVEVRNLLAKLIK